MDQILATEYPLLPGEGQGEGDSVGTVDWQLTDNQGTVRDIVQSNGTTTTLVNHVIYDSFGTPSQSPAFASVPLPEIGYAGMRYDALSGMFYVTTRWYDPRSSVFMSQDPLGFGGGQTNLSEYCGNSPANLADPSGMSPSAFVGGEATSGTAMGSPGVTAGDLANFADPTGLGRAALAVPGQVIGWAGDSVGDVAQGYADYVDMTTRPTDQDAMRNNALSMMADLSREQGQDFRYGSSTRPSAGVYP